MKKILVIEDEKNVRETLCDLLQMNGYETLEAADGEDGITICRMESPDVVICDVNMPRKNGYEVLATLKEEKRLTLTSFVFLTANATMDQLRLGMEAGADDYLIKPFSNQSLMRTLKSIEDKKGKQLKEMHSLKHKLMTEKVRIRDINELNSHEIRRKMSLLQGLLPLIRNGEISFHEGFELLENCGEEIDKALHLLSALIDERNGTIEAKKDKLNKVTTIWLIDDDRIQNLINRMILKKMNRAWEISEFTNAQQALNQLDKFTPDLIFLDISMPEMSGFDFLNQIQKKDNSQLKIAMLSSSITYQEIKKAISFSQVINYITKPLKEEKLQGFLS